MLKWAGRSRAASMTPSLGPTAGLWRDRTLRRSKKGDRRGGAARKLTGEQVTVERSCELSVVRCEFVEAPWAERYQSLFFFVRLRFSHGCGLAGRRKFRAKGGSIIGFLVLCFFGLSFFNSFVFFIYEGLGDFANFGWTHRVRAQLP